LDSISLLFFEQTQTATAGKPPPRLLGSAPRRRQHRGKPKVTAAEKKRSREPAVNAFARKNCSRLFSTVHPKKLRQKQSFLKESQVGSEAKSDFLAND
jgi:hypothetical protein